MAWQRQDEPRYDEYGTQQANTSGRRLHRGIGGRRATTGRQKGSFVISTTRRLDLYSRILGKLHQRPNLTPSCQNASSTCYSSRLYSSACPSSFTPPQPCSYHNRPCQTAHIYSTPLPCSSRLMAFARHISRPTRISYKTCLRLPTLRSGCVQNRCSPAFQP